MNIEELAFKNWYELINIQKIDLLLIIEFLQKDRKQWINQFTQTHNESIEIQKENKILKENAENNDKVVDKVNWDNQLLKKKNKQLQERMEYLERSNNRREDTIFEQSQKINDLEDNWDKLKEHLTNRYNNGTESISYRQVFLEIREMMQEIEQGSDSNENN